MEIEREIDWEVAGTKKTLAFFLKGPSSLSV